MARQKESKGEDVLSNGRAMVSRETITTYGEVEIIFFMYHLKIRNRELRGHIIQREGE